MATRFYLPGYQVWPHPLEHTFSASWGETNIERTVGTSRVIMVAPSSDVDAEFPTAHGNFYDNTGVAAAGPLNVLIRALCSHPLDGDQTITGTVKGQIRAIESNASANAMAQMTIRVMSNDLQTVRGTLLATHTNALSSEFPTGTHANRKFPLSALSPASLTSVDALDGDRIMIEIGARKTEAGSTSRNYSVAVGTASATDLAEDETTTTADNPWIELSQTLVFRGHPPRVGSLCLMGLGG
jgi:hypothetical protein